jgi:hypothetical protein
METSRSTGAAGPLSGTVSPDTDWIPGRISLPVDLVSWLESPSHLTDQVSVDHSLAFHSLAFQLDGEPEMA